MLLVIEPSLQPPDVDLIEKMSYQDTGKFLPAKGGRKCEDVHDGIGARTQ